MRIGINGYGRIGRCIVRAIFELGLDDEFEIVAINDLADPDLLCHLTRVDSTHGRFHTPVSREGDSLTIGKQKIRLLQNADPATLPWRDLGVDLVLECTGKMKSRDQNEKHLIAGAPRVLASHPVSDADKTVVFGVNHSELNSDHRIVSNASCTTNCLAPIAKVLNDHLGIKQGIMTTIHAYTNDQQLLDKAPGDIYRVRSATQSMIPTRTGAANAVGQVLPELKGKLTGMAIRVPTPNVSLVDFHCEVLRDTSEAEINHLMREAAEGTLKDILVYNDEPMVSIDFNHHPASSIFDANHTTVLNRQIRVMSWYDNEWGFAVRMLDVARAMGSL